MLSIKPSSFSSESRKMPESSKPPVDLPPSKDADHWFTDPAKFFFREIGYKVV